MVIKATLANFASALLFASSDERSEATFIFFACSRIPRSWAATVCQKKINFCVNFLLRAQFYLPK